MVGSLTSAQNAGATSVSTGRAAAGDNGAGEIYFVQAGKVSRTIKNRTTRPAPPSMNGVTQAVVNVPRPPISQNY